MMQQQQTKKQPVRRAESDISDRIKKDDERHGQEEEERRNDQEKSRGSTKTDKKCQICGWRANQSTDPKSLVTMREVRKGQSMRMKVTMRDEGFRE